MDKAKPMDKTDKQADKAPLNAKEEAADFFKSAMIAIVVAILIRSLLWEPFNIPSGSMNLRYWLAIIYSCRRAHTGIADILSRLVLSQSKGA